MTQITDEKDYNFVCEVLNSIQNVEERMKTKKLNKKRLILTLLILLFILMFIFLGCFLVNLLCVDRNDKTLVEFVVNEGESGYNVI